MTETAAPPAAPPIYHRPGSMHRTLTTLRIAFLPFVVLIAVWWIVKIGFGLDTSVLP